MLGDGSVIKKKLEVCVGWGWILRVEVVGGKELLNGCFWFENSETV